MGRQVYNPDIVSKSEKLYKKSFKVTRPIPVTITSAIVSLESFSDSSSPHSSSITFGPSAPESNSKPHNKVPEKHLQCIFDLRMVHAPPTSNVEGVLPKSEVLKRK